MAMNPSANATMAGRITAPTSAYPYGSSKNESSPGAGDGTPYFAGRANDIFGLQQALLRAAGIVPTGNADTALASQYLQAIVELASGRAEIYDDSGVANAYVLDLRANQQGPASYFDGLTVAFTPGNANTGASTVNVAGLGSKNIKLPGGADPSAADISGRSKLIYDLANDWFELQIAVDSADGVSYDNSTSGLTATDVQTAIDQVYDKAVGGTGQSWQNLLASRAVSVVYTNTTGRPIMVIASIYGTSSGTTEARGYVDGVFVSNSAATYRSSGLSTKAEVSFIVPPGSTYEVRKSGSATTALGLWTELR